MAHIGNPTIQEVELGISAQEYPWLCQEFSLGQRHCQRGENGEMKKKKKEGKKEEEKEDRKKKKTSR